MQRTIKFGDYEVPFKATAATLSKYRNTYGRDLLADLKDIMKAAGEERIDGKIVDLFVCFAHTMARQADPTIEADPFEWVDRYDIFPIQEIFLPLVNLWMDSLGMTVETVDDKKKDNQPDRKQPD